MPPGARVYAAIPGLQLWARVASGNGQLAGVSIGGGPPAPTQGEHLELLGPSTDWPGRDVLVTADVARTNPHSSTARVDLELFQTFDTDPDGLSIHVKRFWTQGAFDDAGVARLTLGVAVV